MRILVAVACLLPFALAAEAAINRNSPDAAVNAAYAADKSAIQGRGAGIMGDNALRARFFSRSLLRSIAADEYRPVLIRDHGDDLLRDLVHAPIRRRQGDLSGFDLLGAGDVRGRERTGRRKRRSPHGLTIGGRRVRAGG